MRKVLESTENLLPVDGFASLPYFGFSGDGDGDGHPIRMAVDLHLSCNRRVGSKSANPYLDICHGFHITFYEALTKDEALSKNGRNLQSYERWKTGNLYASDPDASDGIRDGNVFRQSAFTVSSLSLDKSNK